MRKIGINYNSFYMRNCGIGSPAQFFEYLSKLKIKNLYVQLGEESSNFLLNKSELEKIKNAKEENNLEIAIHHPEIDIMNKDFEKYYKKILTALETLNSKYLVVHFPKTEVCEDETIVKKLGVVRNFNLCLENTQGGYYSDISNILNFIKKNPDFCITLDVGHLNVALGGDIYKFLIAARKLDENKDKVRILHVHLNDGEKDLHYPVYPHRKGQLNPFYFAVKEIIKDFIHYALIIEESHPRDEFDLKNMINCLHLIYYENL